jgi:hypothetical protein
MGSVMIAVDLPDDVRTPSREWLTSIFQVRCPGAEVTVFTIDKIWEGTALKVRISAEYNDIGTRANLPTSFIVKGVSPEHLDDVEFCYVGEVAFYRDLQSQVDINTPECIFAASDPLKRQHLVVLEDLELRGVHFPSVHKTLTYRQATEGLDILASLHAKWWDSPELDPPGSLGDLRLNDVFPQDDVPPGPFVRSFLEPENWAKSMALPRAASVSRIFHDRERMGAALYKGAQLNVQRPLCFSHGDPHLGNLFIDAEGKIGILDMQCICRSHYAHDLSYFLGSTLDIADRRAWDRALISYYLTRLGDLGVENPPAFDRAWADYSRNMITSLFYWLVDPASMQAEENACAVASRLAAAALDLGTLDLLDRL